MTSKPEPVMFRCTNQRCGHAFLSMPPPDGYKSAMEHPDCEKCGEWCKNMDDFRPGAPAVLSAKTRGSDHALKELANRYDLSDMGQRGGTRIGETALQVQNRALETGSSVCTPTKSHLATKIEVPAGGARFAGGGKAIPTKVVAAHKG